MVKCVARLIGYIIAIPYRIGYAIGKALLGDQRAFTAQSERIAKLAGMVGLYTRAAYYRAVLAGVGEDVYIGFMTLFSKRGARLGDRVYIGRFCTIGYAVLEDDVMLADGVQILSGRHQHGSSAEAGQALRDNQQQFSQVTIGQGAWIGANAVIMADVGAHAVVAAGAVVVKPVPPNDKVGGVPAKPLNAKS